MENLLPKNWTIAKLSDLIDYVIGGDWGKDVGYINNDYIEALCIRGSEFRKWKENKGSTASLRKIKKSSLASRFLKIDDILLEISGGGPEQPVGRTVIIDKSVLSYKPDLPKVCTNFLRLMRPSREISSSFLNYYLKLFYGSGKIVEYQGGSNNLRNLKFNDFFGIDIPLAPLNEQKRILAKLEQLLTDLDKGIEYLETTKQQLKVYRTAVLKWAFEGIKEFDYLNEIGKWMGGGTPSTQKKEYWENGNVLWVSSQDVKSKYIIDTERKITETAIDNSSTKWIKKGSLLFVIRSGILRRIFPIAIAQQDLCVNQDIQTLYLNENYQTEFVYWYLLGNESDIRHNCAKDGTTVESIDVQKLKKYQIPKATLLEQNKIIQKIESRLSVCDKIEETIENSLQQAEALRLSIMKKAFEGKLVSQDPNDEPAEKLLESIRAHRQAQGKQGKAKPEKKMKAEKKPTQKRKEKIEI